MTYHTEPAASLERVLGKIKVCGGSIIDDKSHQESIELAIDGKTLFIPKPLVGGGYTLAQLEKIESTLAYFGIDLLPLDDHMQ